MTDNEKILSDYKGSPVALYIIAIICIVAMIYALTNAYFYLLSILK